MRLASVACCALLLGVATGCGSSAETGSKTFERADASTLVLGPRDLGRGYAMGSDTACGPFAPEEERDRFTEFVYRARPRGCRNEIAYIWGGRRGTVFPRSVESSVAIFDGEDDARQALEMRAELIRFMVGTSLPRGFEPLRDFGHDAVRFRNSGDDVPAEAGVIWRNGNLLAVVLAGGEGMTRDYADDKAVELAVKQQKRIEDPQAQVPAEKMDPELPLDDPTLEVPVYWLGRRFEPGGGLPALELGSAYAGGAPPELGWTVEMDYGAREPPSSVKISVFSPDAFETFARGVLGQQVIGARCAESTERKVPGGSAVIWRGFAKPVDGACPNLPYDRYVAYVYLKGAVVSINQPWCLYPCASPYPGNPYNTERGVAEIAKSLRVREPRAD